MSLSPTPASEPCRTVARPTYEAVVDAHGRLIRLAVAGLDFLAPPSDVPGPGTLFDESPPRLAPPDPDAPDTLRAESERAALRYDFGDDGFTLTIKNLTPGHLSLLLPVALEVEAVRDDAKNLHPAATCGDGAGATWFRGPARLEVKGLSRRLAPWATHAAVMDLWIDPGAERILEWTPGRATDEEAEAVAALRASPPPAPRPVGGSVPMTLVSPRPWSVVQRDFEDDEGVVLVEGHVDPALGADGVRVVVEYPPREEGVVEEAFWLDPHPTSGRFSLRIELPALEGWYRLVCRAECGKRTVAEAVVEPFGVGEVFVGAGQSNSTNCGEFRTRQTSGMVSTFSGEEWRLADDPQLGVADRSESGSFWPAFGDALYEKLKVPIGIATTGYGGTSVNHWQPDTDLFQWFMTRVHQLGPWGFRAVLWHQGESDWAMSTEEYFLKLRRTIETSRRRAGWELPWFVAQATYHNAGKPAFPAVRAAQQRLRDEGLAFRGPDTDTLTGDCRDCGGAGIHFSPTGLKRHGELWAELVSEFIGPSASFEGFDME